MSTFHLIERFTFEEEAHTLWIDIAGMENGEPDGLIGLPLVVSDASSRYRVTFRDIGRIEIVPEPMTPQKNSRIREAPFLYRELESTLLKDHRWDATTFNFGRRFASEDELLHYLVYAENMVVHVLTLSTPNVVSVNAA